MSQKSRIQTEIGENKRSIKHDPPSDADDTGRFYLPVDGHEVVVRYQLKGDDQIDLKSTFTPPELRRQGLARELVNHVLDYADAEGLEVIPTCWYVQKVMQERKAEADKA